MAKLTKKQEDYKNNRIIGMEPIDAYRQAYDSKTKNSATISKEAARLEKNPLIAPAIESARKEATERALVTVEDVVRGLLLEASYTGDGASHGARVSAWKQIGEFTGGFDKNKQQVEQKNVSMTHEEWLASLR